MSKKKEISIRSSAAEYLTFVAATGEQANSIEMRYEDENIWLTQKMMAELYGVTTDYLLGVERKRVIDISGLSEREAATVRDVVECFQKCHSKTE